MPISERMDEWIGVRSFSGILWDSKEIGLAINASIWTMGRCEHGPKKQTTPTPERRVHMHSSLFVKFKTGKTMYDDKIRIILVGGGVVWEAAVGNLWWLEVLCIFTWVEVTWVCSCAKFHWVVYLVFVYLPWCMLPFNLENLREPSLLNPPRQRTSLKLPDPQISGTGKAVCLLCLEPPI